jgi:hypothetical protein
MKLSQLVSYLNHLDSWNPESATIAHTQQLAPILHSVTTHELQFPELTNQLSRNFASVLTEVDGFKSTIDSVRAAIQSRIDLQEGDYYTNSTVLHDREMRNDSVEWILNRRLVLTQEATEIISARISKYTDWRHPGLVIRPGLDDWVAQMVALDPLYLVDQDFGLLTPATSRFVNEYIRRLRRYQVDEYNERESMLQELPDDQIGFALVYNYFNFKPIELIAQYLSTLFTKLRPGGCLAMTFNNCGRAAGVDLAERNFACYTPESRIMHIINALGFVVAHRYNIDAAVTWIELHKPGKLTSIKGGQALAKIIARN